MEYVRTMPWTLREEGSRTIIDCALFKVKEDGSENVCEVIGNCSHIPFVLGTSDERDPKFCFKHYFEINDGRGTNRYAGYTIIFDKE